MRIFREVKAYASRPSRPLFLALGNFDGVHLGHRKILRRVVSEAQRCGGKSAVFTFRVHPETVLRPGTAPRLLSSPEQKLALFESLGIEACFWVEFTKNFSKLSPEAFAKLLAGRLKVKKIFMGRGARFGHRRAGDAALMRRLGKKLGFEFEEIRPVRAAGGVVSSSRIRSLVEAGHLQEACRCLGRPYSLLARVIRGSGRGKGLGYPTANLKISSQILPPQGVYPVLCRVAGQKKSGPWLQGVLNYGLRPTFKDKTGPQMEAFLLDYRGNLYGKALEVLFFPRLRAEKTFSGADKLRAQIARDVRGARKALKIGRLAAGRNKEGSLQTRASGLY